MLPWSAPLAGRIDERVITSEVLRGNPLGDPSERPLWVYLPPGYDDDPARRYPSVYVIQGYTGHLTMWANRMPYRQPFPETADAVFAAGEAPGAIVVYVDAWTAYGGSQFVDSPGTGRYHSYLCDEVVTSVDANYRTLPAAEHRAIMGKSSGGFGAMITPMLRPDLFGALATHSGDSLYELSYIPGFGQSVRYLRPYDGDIFRWWADFRSRTSFRRWCAGPEMGRERENLLYPRRSVRRAWLPVFRSNRRPRHRCADGHLCSREGARRTSHHSLHHPEGKGISRG